AQRLRRDADAVERSGNVEGASESLLRADTLLQQAGSLDRNWAEPLVVRGEIAGKLSKLSKDPAAVGKFVETGIAYADSAVAIDPRDADAYELRGTIRLEPLARGFVQDPRAVDEVVRHAETDLREAIRLNP